MLRNAQWMCVGIGVAQLVLLVATYAFEGHGEAAYVSDELDHFAWFRILLTGTVIAQICVGSFYLYDWSESARDWRVWVGGLGAIFALTGWSILASTVVGTVDHVTGTLIFLCGTAMYFVLMIDMRSESKYAEAFTSFLFAISGGMAVGFVVTQWTGSEEASATVEWLGFMMQSVCFTAFFALHSFREARAWPTPLEPGAAAGPPHGRLELHPLMPPAKRQPRHWSRSGYDDDDGDGDEFADVESGTI